MTLSRTTGIMADIDRLVGKTGPVQVMEVCGTHTVCFFRSGVKSMLPGKLRLVSGPGCPVCVTSQGYIDTACQLALRSDVTIATYGDMVRVPGRNSSLEELRGRGADVLVVYSARDALLYARENPERKVVFLAVGFDTTAPATAATLTEALELELCNFFILPGHKLLLPAMNALLSSKDTAIDGFILPGHVSVIIGSKVYRPIAAGFKKPMVVTGFEPGQLVMGLQRLLELIVAKRYEVDNVYGVAVSEQGNLTARNIVDRVFEPVDDEWRALGNIPGSGLGLKPEFKRYDALDEFDLKIGPGYEAPGCICADVITGRKQPVDCSLFGGECSPTRPVGPCMVSSEGTCSAWYKYGKPR